MTYQDWCKCSKDILAQAKEYNTWAKEAKKNLLTNIGPRISKLGETGYCGCGFHYGMEIEFGNLIQRLAISWQPCANHCSKIEDRIDDNMLSQIMYESLIERVENAEKSIINK